ncbi:hypothetical protein IJ596_00175 [bacterium]|nr:hypothetical protein [bacterium]
MKVYAINNQGYYFNRKQSEKNSVSFEARFPNGLKRPKHIKQYVAGIDFAKYNPFRKNFGEYTIPVHNMAIYQRLRREYASFQFKELFDFVKKKGTFDYIMDSKTGFVKTSLINRKENELMSDMIWVTDTCNNMELVKSQHPQDCTRILNKIADLYEGQKSIFDEIIQNPHKYTTNNDYIWQGQTGVGHCFVPKTHKPHHWFAKTRLESVGNYLQQASDIILTGLNGGKYGYKTSDEVPQTVVDSIANCTKYLKSINYPKARSCGAWEEQTFKASLTSDTAICNQGMRKIFDLLYEPTKNKELQKLRQRILSSKHGDVFEDRESLQLLLKRGENRIQSRPEVEVVASGQKGVKKGDLKLYERYNDSAMAFMIQTEKINPDDIYKDSAKKIFILKKLAKNLVKDNGAIRYKGDDYLNLDYHTLKNQWTDNKHQNEAEWFLVSEISGAYGAVVKQLLEHIKQKGFASDKDKKLLSIALKGQTEFINRSYARITPKNAIKSNGYSCPAYKVPEAYEAVTTPNGVKYVPGAHNPLTWAQASLYKASEMFLSNLHQLETCVSLKY